MSLPVVISTRFSFWGQSGWQSEASRNRALLFAPERLQGRLALFRATALASLAAQTERAFHLHVLTSAHLPDWSRAALDTMLRDALGDRATLHAAPQGAARKFHRQFLKARYGDDPVAQVVLDDDDGLSEDFIAVLQARIDTALTEDRLRDAARPWFISFPLGFALVHRAGQRPALYRHRYRFINLGLTMLGGTGRSIYAIDHRTAPRRFGATVDRDALMYLRSVHALNDSRVGITDKWQPVPDWRADAAFATRFGYAHPLMAGPSLAGV